MGCVSTKSKITGVVQEFDDGALIGNLINGELTPLTFGQIVYISSGNTIKLAKADASATSIPIGLVSDTSIPVSKLGSVKISGIITSTDWTNVIGSTTLISGAEYFLDPDDAGKMRFTPLDHELDVGKYSVIIGTALSTTDFKIEIHPYVHL